MRTKQVTSVALAAGALLLLATALFAHTRLLRSDPGDGELRADTVHMVRLWFSTPVDGTRDGLEVTGPDGRRVDGRNARVGRDDPTVFEVPVDALRSGRYQVSWTVISADGHPVSGRFAFAVELPADPDADADDAATPAAADPLWLEPVDEPPARVGVLAGGVARWLHLSALVLALGPLLLLRLVVPSATRTIAKRLWALAAVGAVLLLPAALLQLGAQAAALAGSWPDGLSRRVLEPVMAGRWGSLWQIRFGLALLLGWFAVDGTLRAAAGRAGTRVRMIGALAAGALLIVATSFDGHAATTPPVALSVTADALHLAAAATWIGGLLGLTLGVLPALRALPAAEHDAALGDLVPRFSAVALTSVIVLVSTGIYQSWRLVGGVDALVGSEYGRVLLLKLAAFALLLAPAAFNRFVLKPRLREARAETGDTRRFGRLIAAESTLGIVVVALAAWLTGIPPARGDAAPPDFGGFAFEPPLEPPPIAVPLDNGRTFDLAEQRGNAVLLFFGFTNCPDFCPTTLQEWRRVRQLLGDDAAAATRFVFLSVDPQRDTPSIAAEYARSFDPSFIGIAPDSAEVSRIESGFFLRSMRNEPQPAEPASDAHADGHDHAPRDSGDYDVMHSTRYFLIDPDGRVRVMYSWDSSPEEVARDVHRLLGER